MHSHYGLQERRLASAPMIIRASDQSKRAEVEFTVMLSDFSFTSPPDILKGLIGNMGGMPAKSEMKGMSMSQPDETLVVQRWDPVSNRLVSRQISGPPPDIDVKYDALLANRRTLEGPEVFAVKPGQSILLRLIAASSAIRLEAQEPLPDRSVQRSFPSVLGGNMKSYTWTINHASYPNRNSLKVKEGGEVELVNSNQSGMSHPMHLHGHVFEVSEIDGKKINGARRDTVLVPPKSTIKIVFNAWRSVVRASA